MRLRSSEPALEGCTDSGRNKKRGMEADPPSSLLQTQTLMDDYEYVMHGKVFKIEIKEELDGQQKLYLSFGGLLMLLAGDSAMQLEKFKLDMYVYLLVKKVVDVDGEI